jgi:predicted RNA-binding protein with PUA-like domain
MAKNYWLVKQEPGDYSWDTLVQDKRTAWTGVRNFQARNNLKGMKKGDSVLFYHSGDAKEVVGIAEVAREAYPDATAEEGEWVCVDIAPVRPLKTPVTLQAIKADKRLAEVALVRHSRLSVMPLGKTDYERILEWGGV